MTDSSGQVRGAPPHHWVDEEWLGLLDEAVIEPELPIIDPHHHLWHRPHSRYLLPELLRDLQTGHLIRGTVFVECNSMYRASGERAFAGLGEVEFANGMGAMCESGIYGSIRACAGIVAKVDLTHGDLAGRVLESMLARAPDRFRGIRQMAAWDASPEVSSLLRPPPAGLLLDNAFRAGFRHLAGLQLSFDAWVYHPQLGELISLVDHFPDTTIVVNHFGGRAGVGPYAAKPEGVFADWRASMLALGKRPNTVIKLGGIGMRLPGFDFMDRDHPPTSEELATAWGPFFDVCLEAFGPGRCMFESNFPVDKCCASYKTLWNAFKRLAMPLSAGHRHDLCCATAQRTYRLPAGLCLPLYDPAASVAF